MRSRSWRRGCTTGAASRWRRSARSRRGASPRPGNTLGREGGLQCGLCRFARGTRPRGEVPSAGTQSARGCGSIAKGESGSGNLNATHSEGNARKRTRAPSFAFRLGKWRVGFSPRAQRELERCTIAPVAKPPIHLSENGYVKPEAQSRKGGDHRARKNPRRGHSMRTGAGEGARGKLARGRHSEAARRGCAGAGGGRPREGACEGTHAPRRPTADLLAGARRPPRPGQRT